MYIYIYGIIWLYCDQHGNLMLLADNVFDFDLFFFGAYGKPPCHGSSSMVLGTVRLPDATPHVSHNPN